jgi:hypothetical protein
MLRKAVAWSPDRRAPRALSDGDIGDHASSTGEIDGIRGKTALKDLR